MEELLILSLYLVTWRISNAVVLLALVRFGYFIRFCECFLFRLLKYCFSRIGLLKRAEFMRVCSFLFYLAEKIRFCRLDFFYWKHFFYSGTHAYYTLGIDMLFHLEVDVLVNWLTSPLVYAERWSGLLKPWGFWYGHWLFYLWTVAMICIMGRE